MLELGIAVGMMRALVGLAVGTAMGGSKTVTRLLRGAVDTALFWLPGDRQSEREWEWSIGGLDRGPLSTPPPARSRADPA